MAKIGIYGGSFDPIHNAHIKVAQTAKNRIGLDMVIFIPSGTPPHKMGKDLEDAADRYNMTCLATEGIDGFLVSDIEINKKTPCYSYQTFEELKQMYPDDELYFIIGTDSLLMLDKWKRPDILSSLCTFIVINREDAEDFDEVLAKQEYLNKEFGTKCIIINIEKMDISSTKIRTLAAASEPYGEFVDKKVFEYIENKKLYR